MTHVCFFYLYLQMDLFLDRQFINPGSLQTGKPYLILDVQHITTLDGPQLVARLWFNGLQDVCVKLSQYFAIRFGANYLRLLNNPRLVWNLVYRDRTRSGTPIFEFEYAGAFR